MNPENWLETLSQIEKEFDSCLGKEDINLIEQKFLGRKGKLSLLLRELSSFPLEERKKLGVAGNSLKEKLSLLILEFKKKSASTEVKKLDIDITLDGYPYPSGSSHPITITTNKIIESFTRLGFSIKNGPLIERDYYNFEALNFPPDHPARDMQDTFYLNMKDETGKEYLLRTHTSPVQIRTMQSLKPPLRVISPGKVFRSEAVDASHSFVFHQIEGFYVDKNVSMSDLKWTLESFIKDLFGSSAKIRFSPSYFPFVEPGAQVEVSCVFCSSSNRGKCHVCKGTGWLEMLGAGMIHPEVLKACNYDYNQWSGFAFGLGVERFAMLLFGIDDMRAFYENDLRILKQVKL